MSGDGAWVRARGLSASRRPFALRACEPRLPSAPALCRHDPKRIITPVVNRTLHTYHSTLRILCEAFQIETDGVDFRCEKRLIEEARRLNAAGKMLAPIIDDAHLMDVSALRRIRLLFEDFPKNHCLVLVAQPELLSRLALTVNEDIKNRVTYGFDAENGPQ